MSEFIRNKDCQAILGNVAVLCLFEMFFPLDEWSAVWSQPGRTRKRFCYQQTFLRRRKCWSWPIPKLESLSMLQVRTARSQEEVERALMNWGPFTPTTIRGQEVILRP